MSRALVRGVANSAGTRRPLMEAPPGTLEYTVRLLCGSPTRALFSLCCRAVVQRVTVQVQAEDSLPFIAVKFDMTPAELRRVNRLHQTAMIFPGQVCWTA